ALYVELGRAGLEHEAEPEVALRVGFEIEGAGRPAFALQRHLEALVLERPGVEASEHLSAEVAVPDDAVRVRQHVMRLDGRVWQVVFGDDHAGPAALHARHDLELELLLAA